MPMSARSVVLLLVLTASAALHAQPFVVTQTAPADFAANMPLSTTLAFTFSAPLADLATTPAPAVVGFPTDAFEAAEPTLSADRRTLSVPVTLQPSTRYVVLLPTARSETGVALARPAVINLTTGSGGGFLTVRGTVTDPAGGSVDGTLAAIVTADLTTGAIELVAMRVLDAAAPSQTYTLGPLPLGVYFAAALRLPGALLGGAPSEPALGYYDPNGDGTPDPITSPMGNDITLQPPPASTAAASIDAVTAEATAVVPDAFLDAIPPRPVDIAGASTYWVYRFASPTEPDDVVVYQIGPLAVPVVEPAIAPFSSPLPTPFVDSDVALAAADAAGGGAFRALHAGQTVTVTMETAEPTVAPVPVWRLRYEADGPPVGGFEADVDLVTGLVVGTTAAGDAPTAEPPGLTLQGANPVRGSVRLVATVPGGPVRVDVLDALGRTVAVLHDGPLPAGLHRLDWAADVPAGVYHVRLRATATVQHQPVTVVR